MAPSSNKQWTVEGTTGFDSLTFNENAAIPEVGDKDVLVKSTSALVLCTFLHILTRCQFMVLL